MAAFWPTQPDDNPMAASLNSAPEYVATQSTPPPEWAGAVRVRGRLTARVQQLRAEGEGDVVILGSGGLVRQLLAVDLIDELRLFIPPLLVGDGKRLLGGVPEPWSFRLKSISTTSEGIISAVYTNDSEPPDRPNLTR